MSGRDAVSSERRRLLGMLGAGVAVGTAGCLDQFGADGSAEDDGDESDDGAERTFEPNLEHPGDGPIEFTREQSCPVCNMTPTDYSDWHSQIAHEDGDGGAFDTSGCMFAYIVATASESPIVGAWTVDHETGDLIDATEAYFVLVTDDTAVDDPMGLNPRAFADEDDAIAFVDEWDAEELSEDDVIEFDDIDREVAEIYRGNRM